MIKDNLKNEWVVKSNRLIEARMKFTANEYKIITYLAGKIEKNDREFRTFDIEIKELNKYCFGGISGTKTYNYIKHKYSETLSKKDIKIKGNNGLSIYNWFTVIDTNKRGIFSICFSPELKDFLLEDAANYEKGGYTKYKLSNIIDFKNFYSMRIYELLKQYEKLGKRTISVEKLRYILGLEEKHYKIYRDFRKWVIMPSIDVINQKTDIKVTFEEVKSGRKTEEIAFYMVSNRTIHKSKELLEIKERMESVLKTEVQIDMLEEKIKKNNLKAKDIYFYLDNWNKFDYKRLDNPVGFILYCASNKIPLPQYRRGVGGKPEQATNFEQREYSDEFFESLYDNF